MEKTKESPFDRIVKKIEDNPKTTIVWFVVTLLVTFFCIPLLIGILGRI